MDVKWIVVDKKEVVLVVVDEELQLSVGVVGKTFRLGLSTLRAVRAGSCEH